MKFMTQSETGTLPGWLMLVRNYCCCLLGVIMGVKLCFLKKSPYLLEMHPERFIG